MRAFRDPRVQERLKEVKILKFDLTDMTAEAQALLKKLDLFGSPAILFFNEQGQEIKTARLIGEQEADRSVGTSQQSVGVISRKRVIPAEQRRR